MTKINSYNPEGVYFFDNDFMTLNKAAYQMNTIDNWT